MLSCNLPFFQSSFTRSLQTKNWVFQQLEMAVDGGSYEDCRRKRLEENKKRMEELKLTQLSHKLRNASRKTSPSGKPQKETIPVEVRRSSRVKETIVYFQRPRSYKQRDLLKATEVQSNLDPKFPTFVKHMLQSYVTGYKLVLPLQFCKKNLPLSDDTITLVDEDGDEYQTVYLSKNKPGLSGGWRGFSLAHDLVDGDALVFQLIKTTTFKVEVEPMKGELMVTFSTTFVDPLS